MDYYRLCESIRRDRRVLEWYRVERMEAVRSYVGKHWAMDGSRLKIPVNLLSLYVQVVGRNLIANNPRVLMSTFTRQHKATVAAMQDWANDQIVEMQLTDTLARWVVDALFGLGVMKTALATPSVSSMAGWNVKAGSAFCERVDLDDFVFDTRARDFREIGYVGHRVRVPIDTIRDSSLYSKGRKNLVPMTDNPYNLEGDPRIWSLGRSRTGADADFEDMVELWELYIPRKRLVCVLPEQSASGAPDYSVEPLLEKEWIGPDHGPYHFLSFGIVPGNPMPKAPIQDLIDLHDVVNRLYRKIGNQAERQKEVLAVAMGAAEDGSRIMEANDGQVIRVDRPEACKPMSFGGANQQTLGVALHLKNLFGYMAGNLDMMGGLSSQSPTLGQDQLLNQNSSRSISYLQERTTSGVSSVLRAMGWFWWHDPFQVMQVEFSLPGLPQYSIVRHVAPQKRQQVAWKDLKLKVDPYSLQHTTPQMRASALTQLLTQIVIPLMPLLEKQGIMLDMHALLTKLAEYMDMPDLPDILTIGTPPQGQSQDQGAPAPETTRNYVRQSMPGRTRQGDEQNMTNSLMGIDTGGAQSGNGQQGAGYGE